MAEPVQVNSPASYHGTYSQEQRLNIIRQQHGLIPSRENRKPLVSKRSPRLHIQVGKLHTVKEHGADNKQVLNQDLKMLKSQHSPIENGSEAAQ